MAAFLSKISVFFIPGIITAILLYAFYKKAPLYDLFTEGAKDGLLSAVEMAPFIIAIFVGIEAITVSGALDFFRMLLAPIFEFLHVPEDLIPLILLRPVSGSGSMVLAERIMEKCGTDTFIGRTACSMVGSCETVFYVMALYFGVTAVKKMRHTFVAGILGYVAGIAASLFFCKFF